MSGALALRVALGNHAHVMAIKDGSVPIETLIAYAAQQHLIPTPMKADDVFLDPQEVHA
jgi:hypothetical protein